MRPTIDDCECTSPDAVHDARIDDTYHRRSIVNALVLALWKRFTSTLHSKSGLGQYERVALEVAIRDINVAISDSVT